MPKTKKTPKKTKSVKALKKLVWKDFSIYIRMKQADWRGYGSCVTCKVVLPWKSLQAGHFISRSKSNTLFNELNVWPQCYRCNIKLNGNVVSYYRFLQEVIGDDAITELVRLSEISKKWTIEELENLREQIKKKSKDLVVAKHI